MYSPFAATRLAPLRGEQAALLDAWKGPTLVLGGPGTGKTTVIGWAAVRQVRADAAQPVVLAGSRAAASLLRNAITVELGDGSWRPVVTTVHALARTVWQRFSGQAEVRLLSAPEQEFRVRELLAGAGAEVWPATLRHAFSTRAFAAQVRASIARARQLGLDPGDVERLGDQAGRPEWVALGRFFAEYLDVLDLEGVLDYAELVHRSRLLLAEPEVSAVVGSEIGSLLVDDYADLDPAQLAFVAALAPGVPLLATADPDSVSANFRGADPYAVRTFADTHSGATVVTLTQSRRFGRPLDAALERLRSRMPQVVGVTPATYPAKDPEDSVAAGVVSEVVVLECASQAEQARAILAQVRRAHLADGIPFDQMAVLSRSGRRSVEMIVQALIADQIPVSLAADEIPLAQAPSVRALLLGLAVAGEGEVRPEDAERLLTSGLGGLDAVSLRTLARAWRATQPAAMSTLPLTSQWARALNDVSWTQADPANAVVAQIVRLSEVLGRVSQAIRSGSCVDELLWLLWQGTDWPARLAREATGGGPSASRADADLDALCALFETAAEADRRGGAAGVRAFLAELATQQIPADRQREARLASRGVEVLTAHRSRGREWDLVIVAGVQEGDWPLGRGVRRLLDPAELSAHGLVGATSAGEALAGERRLFHLACSRARRRLVVTATAGNEGESDAPSRFVAELGVRVQSFGDGRAPMSLHDLVVELRRVATASESSPSIREAAAAELARLSEATDDSGRALAAAARPQGWWGVRPLSRATDNAVGEVRLSPSQVGALLTCPRRFFLDRRAGGVGQVSTAPALGSLTHALIQSTVEHGWGLAEVREAIDRAWPQFTFEAEWQSRFQRNETERSLERFFSWWQRREAELVGVEVGFELPLEFGDVSVRLVGKVDWLERAAGGARVIDFKTSKAAPPAAEVAAMDQLGVYQLAAQAGALGDGMAPQGAAAVYLRVAGRSDELPKECPQEPLGQRPYLGVDPDETDYPTWVHARVAQAARVVVEGRYPARPGENCRRCAFATSCPADQRGRQVI